MSVVSNYCASRYNWPCIDSRDNGLDKVIVEVQRPGWPGGAAKRFQGETRMDFRSGSRCFDYAKEYQWCRVQLGNERSCAEAGFRLPMIVTLCGSRRLAKAFDKSLSSRSARLAWAPPRHSLSRWLLSGQ